MSSTASQSTCSNGLSNVLVNKLNSFIYTEDDVREETVLEKQTVKITSPSHELNCITNSRRSYSSNNSSNISPITSNYSNVVIHHEDPYLNLELKDLRTTKSSFYPAPGFRILSSTQWETNGNRLPLVDRECQTDLFLADTELSFQKMTDDRTIATLESSPGTSSTGGSSSSGIVMDDLDHVNKSLNEDLIEAQKDNESRDRELEDIHVVINDSRLNAAIVREQPRAISKIEENKSFEEKDIQPDYAFDSKGRSRIPIKEEENDSCCVDCIYVTFNVCECSIM